MTEMAGCWVVVYFLLIGHTPFQVRPELHHGQAGIIDTAARAVKRWSGLEPHITLMAIDIQMVDCPAPKVNQHDEDDE